MLDRFYCCARLDHIFSSFCAWSAQSDAMRVLFWLMTETDSGYQSLGKRHQGGNLRCDCGFEPYIDSVPLAFLFSRGWWGQGNPTVLVNWPRHIELMFLHPVHTRLCTFIKATPRISLITWALILSVKSSHFWIFLCHRPLPAIPFLGGQQTVWSCHGLVVIPLLKPSITTFWCWRISSFFTSVYHSQSPGCENCPLKGFHVSEYSLWLLDGVHMSAQVVSKLPRNFKAGAFNHSNPISH